MRHRLILFDNDGTLNTQFSCWRYTQVPLGIFDQGGRRLLEDHLEGKMDYEEFAKKTVALWKGLSIRDFEEIISKIALRDGALKVLKYFREHDYRICAASSGFDLWRDVFQNRHDFIFDDFLANHLIVDGNGVLSGEIEMNVTDDTPEKNKGEQIKKLVMKYGMTVEESIMIGDGLGDVNAFKVAGVSFAIAPTHEEVAKASDHVIIGNSLEPILEYFDNGVYIGNRVFQEGRKS